MHGTFPAQLNASSMLLFSHGAEGYLSLLPRCGGLWGQSSKFHGRWCEQDEGTQSSPGRDLTVEGRWSRTRSNRMVKARPSVDFLAFVSTMALSMWLTSRNKFLVLIAVWPMLKLGAEPRKEMSWWCSPAANTLQVGTTFQRPQLVIAWDYLRAFGKHMERHRLKRDDQMMIIIHDSLFIIHDSWFRIHDHDSWSWFMMGGLMVWLCLLRNGQTDPVPIELRSSALQVTAFCPRRHQTLRPRPRWRRCHHLWGGKMITTMMVL